MNEYDSNRIYDLVKKIDYQKTDNLNEVNCYVLNTCHIREKATEKVYHDIGRIKKKFKDKKKPIVIVTGCVAQAEGEILLSSERYIDAVIGPQSYHKFNQTIIDIENKKNKINMTEFDTNKKFDNLNVIENSASNVSSFLTIQEGCDKFCKFCVVPYTRGPEFSRSIEDLIKETSALVENGTREVTLLGQNVNAYNYNGKRLSDLIIEISKINKIKRIRYTTSHPIDFSEDLIEAHKKVHKLMPLIHLPIQSGSDKILKKMNRKHSIQFYLNLVKKLKCINNRIEFSSDFIIGYPGETDQDFASSIKLLKEIKYINTYSFVFSPRPGTPASKMKKINKNVSKERLATFQKLAKEIKIKYRKNLLNKSSLVLFENSISNKNTYFGRDEYSNPVIVKSTENLRGKIREVKIFEGNQGTLFGELEENKNNEEFAA
tara:strand:+ start:2986 stop:4281 length:1296 start_codon:yes stop_codon:yes gene_type:complete